MDKYTNGFATIPVGEEANAKDDIRARYEAICLEDYGVKAKVKVTLTPIKAITEEETPFTHGYKVRCRG